MNHQDPHPKNDGGSSSILEWTRRNFLRYVGTAAAAGAAPEVLSGCAQQATEDVSSGEQELGVGPTTAAIASSYVIARASDGFDMQMDLINLQVNASRSLVQISTSTPSYVILRTHPQHTTEGVSSIATTSTSTFGVDFLDVLTYSSGPSRLVFCLPAGFAGVPFALNSILALLSNTTVNVAANALSDGALAAGNNPNLAPAAALANTLPAPTVTAIEIPYRLLLSPNEQSRIVHSNPPATPASSGRVELANSRLAVAGASGTPDERSQASRAIRALYTRDATSPNNASSASQDPAGEGPLPAFVRERIVAQTSVFSSSASVQPPSVQVDNLILTPHGGTFHGNGNWEALPSANASGLVTWKHRTAIGRDDMVQATLTGYVLPFGLRAIVVLAAKRQLNPLTEGYASLLGTWQLHFIDTQRSFSAFPGLPIVGHRAMPFQSVTVQQTTFDIDTPANPTVLASGASVGALYFAAALNSLPVSVPMTAVDRRGRLVKFSAPIFWVCNDSTSPKAGSAVYSVKTTIASGPSTSTSSNVISLNRQRVALAPATKDHTTVEVDWMQFGTYWASTQTAGAPLVNNFYPYVSQMSALPEAARNLAGVNSSVLMSYDASYAPALTSSNVTTQLLAGVETLTKGVVQPSPKQALVGFTSTIGAPISNSKSSGGLAMPSATFQAIGMTSGLQSSASDVTTASVSWSTLLGNAKLFGTIGLDAFAEAAGIKQPPAFVSEAYNVAERYAAELEALASLASAATATAQASSGGSLAQLASAPGLAANSALTGPLAAMQTAIGNISGVLTDPSTITSTTIGSIASDLASLVTMTAPGSPLDNAIVAVGYPNSGLARAARNQLQKLQSAITAGLAVNAPAAPNALTQALDALNLGLEAVRDQKAKIEWIIPISGGVPQSGIFANLLTFGAMQQGGDASTFCLSVEINGKASDPSQAMKMFCSLDNFTLNFPPTTPSKNAPVQLSFDRIFLSQQPGQKLEVDVNLNGLAFAGALQFIETIMTLIPLDGFSDPPHIDVTDEGIDAGFSVALPDIACGVLAFENLSVSADLNVPFIGEAITFTFGFCSSDSPFLVTVAFLGGGGYFNITLAAEGSGLAIQGLEASVDVCAQLAVNLGVAAGSLTARAGITICYDFTTSSVSITAFVDLRGALDILGLVSMCIEAYLGLTYDGGTNSLSGECKLIVDVDVCGFSKGVVLDFQQTFWGGDKPAPSSATQEITTEGTTSAPPKLLSPTFANAYAGTSWAQYVASFAA